MTIYTYGIGEARRFAPEMPEPKPRTGSLTDVIANPPLSTTVPLRPRNSAFDSRTGTAAPASTTTTTTTTAKTPRATSGNTDVQPALTIPGSSSAVSVGWQASPDQSVVGYNLYTGIVSHQYTNKQPVGNETTAQLPAGQGTIYVAVSAYTAEGIESALSDELVVSASSQTANAAASGFGAGSAGSR